MVVVVAVVEVEVEIGTVVAVLSSAAETRFRNRRDQSFAELVSSSLLVLECFSEIFDFSESFRCEMAGLKASRSRTDRPKIILKKKILKKAILGFTDFSVTKDIESPYQLVH